MRILMWLIRGRVRRWATPRAERWPSKLMRRTSWERSAFASLRVLPHSRTRFPWHRKPWPMTTPAERPDIRPAQPCEAARFLQISSGGSGISSIVNRVRRWSHVSRLDHTIGPMAGLSTETVQRSRAARGRRTPACWSSTSLSDKPCLPSCPLPFPSSDVEVAK